MPENTKPPVVTSFDHVAKAAGTNQTWTTGSQRDAARGKGKYAHVSPIFMRRLARVIENGAEKYGSRNWEKGQPVIRYLESAIRHAYSYLEGKRDEDHLGQAAWNFMAAIHTEDQVNAGNLPKDLLDDLVDLTPAPAVPECPLATKEY
jgi:hypothetical protein